MSNSWPQVRDHTFGFSVHPAVCIKATHLPLDSAQDDALLQIICNETLGAFLWTDLSSIIDEIVAEHGVKMYVGGRSNGWLYAESEYDGDFVSEVLQTTALRMLDEAKEHIAHYLDPLSFGWTTMIGEGMDVYFYHSKAVLAVDGETLAGYAYESLPTDNSKEDRIVRLLLVKALRSAIA